MTPIAPETPWYAFVRPEAEQNSSHLAHIYRLIVTGVAAIKLVTIEVGAQANIDPAFQVLRSAYRLWVIHVAINQECPSIRFRYAPKADVAAGKCREWSIR
jgi:hypothetical protein